jgi:hypothetical protein
MNSVKRLRAGLYVVQGALSFVPISYSAGQPGAYVAIAVLVALLVGSIMLTSDSLLLVTLGGVAVAVGLASTVGGLTVSFAVVVSLLVFFDFVGMAKSLFGLTGPLAVDLQDRETVSRYFRMLGRQTLHSSAVGFAAFVLAISVIDAPIPQVVFGNPVSGTGILALAAILLVLIASGILPRPWARDS